MASDSIGRTAAVSKYFALVYHGRRHTQIGIVLFFLPQTPSNAHLPVCPDHKLKAVLTLFQSPVFIRFSIIQSNFYFFRRWTSDNREIVWVDDSVKSELNKQLLKQYRLPASTDLVINQQSLGVGLNNHNYAHKMHTLLYMEELTRHQIISRYGAFQNIMRLSFLVLYL